MHSIPITRPVPTGIDAGEVGAEVPAMDRSDACEFEALYREQFAGVYGYALARTHDEQDAADLTQQVFAQALAGLPGWRDHGLPLQAWLFRIARNAIVDHHRRARETVAWESLPDAKQPVYEQDLEAAAIRREAVNRLRAVLIRVHPEKRDLLALRFAGELRTREIAHVLGRSESAVKSELRRTLLALREAYDEE